MKCGEIEDNGVRGGEVIWRAHIWNCSNRRTIAKCIVKCNLSGRELIVQIHELKQRMQLHVGVCVSCCGGDLAQMDSVTWTLASSSFSVEQSSIATETPINCRGLLVSKTFFYQPKSFLYLHLTLRFARF